jgi:hypothetical protein
MTSAGERRDLIALVADKDARLALSGILSQHRRLGIRAVDFAIDQHPQHDSGCRVDGVNFLRSAVRLFKHAILMFDHKGCGLEDVSGAELACRIEDELRFSGWEDRARVIVIEPELDIWIWSESPHVAEALGWESRECELKEWLARNGWLEEGQIKPRHPKGALACALRKVNKVHSSAIFGEIACKVSLGRCEDRAFAALKDSLQKWFG